MAKVNLWLRGARGKFAGASLAKGADGETIAREVVTPSNPNTDKQLYQRMIMATVMTTYSAGKEIFDHSFQGRSVGSECQQEFMQRNLLSLRSRVAKDIADIEKGDTTVGKCKTIVVGPKTRTPVPGRFLISDGSYYQTFFALRSSEGTPCLGIPASTQNETVAAYAQRNGLIPGDIYTLCALMPDVEADPVWIGLDSTGVPTTNIFDTQSPCYFQFWRVQVKSNVLESTDTFNATAAGALAKIFDLTAYVDNGAGKWLALNMPTGAAFKCCDKDDDQTIAAATSLGSNFSIGSFGVIRSRLDQDLRSKTEMETFIHDESAGQYHDELLCGISSGSALIQWRKAVEQIGSSNLVLESNS